MNINNIKAGPELYLQVRTGFISQGSSLNKWCLENGIKRQNALVCLKGVWNGPKGTALRERIVIASGIADLPSSLTKVS